MDGQWLAPLAATGGGIGTRALRQKLHMLPIAAQVRLVPLRVTRVEHLALLDDEGVDEAADSDPEAEDVIRDGVAAAEVVAQGRWAHDGRVPPQERIARGAKRARLAQAEAENVALEHGAQRTPEPPRGGHWPSRGARAAASGAPAAKLSELDEKARRSNW